MNHNFKELKIWQKGIDLVDNCYNYTETLLKDERFNLVSANHFAEFLSTSLVSCFGLETHLVICERRNFSNTELRNELAMNIVEIKNMIFNFR